MARRDERAQRRSPGVGMIFHRRKLEERYPDPLLMQPEIQRRILVSNYLELLPQGEGGDPELRGGTALDRHSKKVCPQRQKVNLLADASMQRCSAELLDLTGHDPERLAAYPSGA